LRRIVNLVRDYVASDVGMISLFGSDEESAVWISAHGLGHSRGLVHHTEPIDARARKGSSSEGGTQDTINNLLVFSGWNSQTRAAKSI
jgi:hypothetical protein